MSKFNPFAPEVRARATVEFVLCNGRTKLTDSFLDVLEQRVLENEPRFQRGVIYRSCHLWGKATWDELATGQKHVVGKAIALLVKAGRLPLVFASCPHCTIKRYRLL